MKLALLAPAAALLALGAAGPASAQRGGSITLFQGPDFQGPSRSFSGTVENLADQGFNDMAQSMKVQGRWRVCENAKFRGRCVEVSGDVPNLNGLRLNVAISSLENLGGGGWGGGNNGGWNGGQPNGGQSLAGRSATFFPNPPSNFRDPDDFCRRMGFNGAAYADGRQGNFRDVLCRR